MKIFFLVSPILTTKNQSRHCTHHVFPHPHLPLGFYMENSHSHVPKIFLGPIDKETNTNPFPCTHTTLTHYSEANLLSSIFSLLFFFLLLFPRDIHR